MKLARTCIVLFILVLLLSGVVTTGLGHIQAADSPPSGIWHIETVDSEARVGRFTSLALDGAGRPHIGYPNWSEEYDDIDLKYAWHDGTSWQVQTVATENWVGEYPSLALDGADRPHFSYYDYGNLGYAWHDGTRWHMERVDSKGGYHTSLALDSSGRPHISYQGNFDGAPSLNWDLKYAWHDGARWHIETVDGPSHVGFYTSLALDGLSRPHISYYDYDLDDLKYAWHDGARWHIETVDSEGGEYTSLALDGLGRPHISYHDGFPDHDLRYAWNDGTQWHIEVVDSEGGDYTSLALDGLDRPHISYRGAGPKYAWHDGTQWHIEKVDTSGGDYTSLALDGSGRPHISYKGTGLEYAYLTPFPPLSLSKQAVPSENLHYNDVLTYTLTLYGPGLGVRLWDPLPSALHYVPGSVTGSVTPTAVYSTTAHAITWEGTLPTDVSQEVRFQLTPDITVTKSLSAPLPFVNTAWLTDTDNSRGITATATVNLLPVPLSLEKRATPNDDLRYKDTLTYTLTLYGPGLRARLWDPLPDGVHYIPGSITSTVTPTASYSATVRAVVWEGTLPTDTAQTVRFRVTPGITGTGSLSLSFPIVNTAWLTGMESGRSVSAVSIVNGRRVALPLVVRGRQGREPDHTALDQGSSTGHLINDQVQGNRSALRRR